MGKIAVDTFSPVPWSGENRLARDSDDPCQIGVI